MIAPGVGLAPVAFHKPGRIRLTGPVWIGSGTAGGEHLALELAEEAGDSDEGGVVLLLRGVGEGELEGVEGPLRAGARSLELLVEPLGGAASQRPSCLRRSGGFASSPMRLRVTHDS